MSEFKRRRARADTIRRLVDVAASLESDILALKWQVSDAMMEALDTADSAAGMARHRLTEALKIAENEL